MKYVQNIEDQQPDLCDRSLRNANPDKKGQTFRDTYYLIDPENSPSKNLSMGHTTVYAEGKTTGHKHADMEEVYYVIQGKGRMVVGDSEYDIKAGDALYVPFGQFHTTYNTGILPLQLLWVTGADPSIPREKEPPD
jgi:mannose-6-phosphate isomerase-like protein (cupin superfamily)